MPKKAGQTIGGLTQSDEMIDDLLNGSTRLECEAILNRPERLHRCVNARLRVQHVSD